MALGGSGGYYSSSNIPAAEAALQSAYTRHLFARSSALPAQSGFQVVTGLRNGFNNNLSHDELYWNHTGATFFRANAHRSGSYVSAQMSAGNFATNTWLGIAATWDGTNLRSYINGVADGVSANSTIPTAADTQVTLGGGSDYDNSPSNLFTNGQVAELAIWDVVLSVDEIASLSKGFRAPLIRPNNLVFYTPVVRGKQELIAGRTMTLGAGSETVTDHPRVFG